MKKSSAINERLCQGKDVFERMNYLHQASALISSKNMALASYYGSIMTGCAKKAVLRIEHNLKRSICKGCHSPLIPGKTAKVRVVKRHVKTICTTCKCSKKIPTKGNYKLWMDQPQAVLETFEYSIKPRTNCVTDDNSITDSVKKDTNIAADQAKKDNTSVENVNETVNETVKENVKDGTISK